jgi:HlyD family secretion protein
MPSPERTRGAGWGWLALVALLSGSGAMLLADVRRVETLPAAAEPTQPPGDLARVGALGRIEPRAGVRHLYGPPRPVAVIEELRVEEGDHVTAGQVIALLAGIGPARADVARARAELASAERELGRNRRLSRSQVVSESRLEALQTARDVARAEFDRAEEELALSTVRSPIDGQVLEVHARAGERVPAEGIAELGETAAMYAIAEVYETDIARVRAGQHAVIRSPALPRELDGTVERVGLKIDKNDVLTTDPVADADARVVEVEIRLLDPAAAAHLTNLRVDVLIDADGGAAPP